MLTCAAKKLEARRQFVAALTIGQQSGLA